MRVCKCLTFNDKVFLNKTKEFFPLNKEPSDEEIKRLVRRAVKNVGVPADLESKTLDLLKKRL